MRDLFSKLATGTVIAAAALAVSACGKSEPVASNDTANVTELNVEDSMMEGSTNDMMTNTDAATGVDGNVADANLTADANASNAVEAANATANATNAN